MNFSKNFDAVFDIKINNKIKLEGKDRLYSICSILKEIYGWTEKTLFWEEYMDIKNKETWQFPDNIYDEFKNIFEVKNWYQIIGFKPVWFKTTTLVQNFFVENGIFVLNEDIYQEWCLKDDRLPPYHKEWFRLDKEYISIGIDSFITVEQFSLI